MAVTMKDIARDLGIAVTTVSEVMRNKADVSEETRKRVLQRVKELHYTQNLAARALVTEKPDLVGLVVPDLLRTFFAEIAKSLSNALLRKNYHLILATSDSWTPRLGLSIDVASGDRNPHDDKLETFNPLFPNGHYLADYTGYPNLIHVKPRSWILDDRSE
jgi:hypothetical protein